jgi:UDP-N-acetylglucosamine 2-epimerase (non-hydrolysing)
MILLVSGARPNFMKIAPLVWEFKKRGFGDYSVVHTGQHYDYEMSQAFFEDLGLDEPDYHLGVGSGTHGDQTARIMLEFEKVCASLSPDLVVVVGDVNSTLACALVAAKLPAPVAHIEAGLRSFDRSMPEEINRVVADHLSDLFLVTERAGVENLRREGIDHSGVILVGNVMIDALTRIIGGPMEPVSGDKRYAVATIHRPINVDTEAGLLATVDILKEVSRKLPVLFFAHPRTTGRIAEFHVETDFVRVDAPPASGLDNAVYLTKPVGYRQFIGYVRKAAAVITDSGGLQAETTWLGIPCITLRDSTEMPVTVDVGTNTLVGRDKAEVMKEVGRVMEGSYKAGAIPDLWDGRAGGRIVDVVFDYLSRHKR